MHLQEINPHPALAHLVRLYRIIDFNFQYGNTIPPKAYTPRPEQCLQFFPTPTILEYPGRQIIIPKNALLSGQHTIISQRTVYQRFLSLQVIFQPGALHRLFGFSLTDLNNISIEAENVFGAVIESINDQLYHAQGHREMIAIADCFMLKFLSNIRKQLLPVDLVTRKMFELEDTLDKYVAAACLSHRQFDRQFIERIGIPPKEYLRVIRFDQAYRMKNRFPEMNWFNIAIDCGYHDYQHLSKNYKNFTGLSPESFFKMDSPERTLGTEEVY